MMMAFFFMPAISRTNKDIQTKRTMLLYLPTQIVARIKTIRLLVNEILAHDNDVVTSNIMESLNQQQNMPAANSGNANGNSTDEPQEGSNLVSNT